ncbi:MAG: flagellar filament capping protein FliD [Sulfuritalea sp.]|nr:flagellar filament capping protein FliD [Sulfuritalea sp.]
MAGISSPGIASGLDVNGIISKLMQLEQQPLTKLAARETSYQAKITAYGSVKSAMSTLQTAAATLADAVTFTGKATSVSDTSVLAAAASSTAAAGSYSISVTQLAKFHAVRSNTAYAATTDTFNTGTLAITVGSGSAVNVVIGSGNNTLAGIRQAINDAGAGVTAAIINDGTTNRLVLSSATSGSTGAIAVAATDSGSGGTHALAGLGSASLVQTQAADNALATINGIDISRSSNTIADVIEGLTLTLAKGTAVAPGTATLTIARNTAATSAAIDSFVSAYNAVAGLLKTNSSYDATTKKGAVLNAESTVRSIQSELSSLVQTSVTGVGGGISTLSGIGIRLQANGTLATDSTVLAAALADPNKDLSALFTQTTAGNEGIAVRFNTSMKAIVAFDGLIAGRTDGIKASIKDIEQTRDALNLRLTQIEARYRAQFSALDVLVTSMNQTSQYLSSQLANLPKIE